MKTMFATLGMLALVLALVVGMGGMTASAQGANTTTPTATLAPGETPQPAQAPPASAQGTNANNPTAAQTLGSQVPSVPGNSAQWFKFDYVTGGYARPFPVITIRMLNAVNSGLGFNVWSPDRLQGNWWNNLPVGRGTPEELPNCTTTDINGNTIHCTTNDLTWVGAFGAPGTYYVQIVNDSNSTLAPHMVVSGSGLAQCAQGTAPAQAQLQGQGNSQPFILVQCQNPTSEQLQSLLQGAPAAAPTVTSPTPAASPTTAESPTPAASPTAAASPTSAASPTTVPAVTETATPAEAATSAATTTPMATETSVGTTTPLMTETPSALTSATPMVTGTVSAATPMATETAMATTGTPMASETPMAALTPAGTPSASASPAMVATGLAVSQNSTLGNILADDQGRTVYMFMKDTNNTSNCTGSCAQLWPPVAVQGTPAAGPGLDASLIGTITRSDGTTQATYNGHPLYYYSGDKAPGDTNGQGIGGNWFVVSPSGNPVQGTSGASGTGTVPATSGTPAGTATP